MLPALAHVPPAHVKTSFELVIVEVTDVIEREFDESVIEKMDELAASRSASQNINITVLFDPRDNVSCEIGSTFGLRTG